MDPEELRADIPAVADHGTAYLNTGGSGPAPRRVVEAASDALADFQYEGHCENPYPAAHELEEEVRERVAAFLGATPDEIALTPSTGDGIARVAAAIDWEPGDVVVRTDLEHPAGSFPWRRAAELEGATVRVLETTNGRIDREDLKAAVEGARLLSLSSTTWTHGTRLPVAEAVEIAHDAGARVLVDAVQSVGHHHVDVGEWGADFVAAAGHKWLLGLWGAGFLYVRPDAVADLEPRQVGYRSVADTDPIELRPNARRLEVGTVPLAPLAALPTAIETIEAVGFDVVRERIGRLTDRLKDGIGDDRLLSPREFESGLVSFDADDPEGLVERADADGVVVRTIPAHGAVRASVHVFNTADDIDRLLDHL